MKLSDITSFRLRGHEICKIYKGTNVIFNVCTGNYEWVLKQEINNPSPATNDYFGNSVSLYGDTLVIGAYQDDAGATNAGSVYVYVRSGNTWSLQQTINNHTPIQNDFFGNLVSLYQDTLVIVASHANNFGSVYVYVRSGTTWSLQQTIDNPAPASDDGFGSSVSLYQDTLAIGATYGGASEAGFVYVYVRSGNTWSLQQTINNPDPASGDYFGIVSLYQDTLAIGAPDNNSGATEAGSVYVYVRSGNTWSLQQTINNPSPAYQDFFGMVSLYQDTLAIGAIHDDTVDAASAGSVFVYVRSGTSWSLQQKMNNPTPEFNYFGYSVSLYQDTLVVGALLGDTGASNTGSVYVYTRSGTTWSLQKTINNPTPEFNYFSYSVSLYQDTLVVGALLEDTGAEDAGSVYVYHYEEL